MSRLSDMTLERYDEAKRDVQKLAAALGAESAAHTALMDDTRALLLILTSTAAAPLPDIVEAAVRGLVKLHPEVAPR